MSRKLDDPRAIPEMVQEWLNGKDIIPGLYLSFVMLVLNILLGQ